MSITIKTPRQVAQEYLDHLKSLRPEVNIDQTDSDWWIRSRVVGGLLSGVYADLNRVSNDAFPQTARREAVDKHLETWFGSGLRAAQASGGNVTVTGTPGSTIAAGTQLIHAETGNVYQVTETTVMGASASDIPVASVALGQDQNLVTGTALAFSSPPAGVSSSAVVLTPGITDGRDEESTADGANRVLQRIRNPSRGGTAADYEAWALAADESVVSARINRHAEGLGSVGVVISAGTADIDAAIDNGDPVVITPSPELVETVRAYVEGMNPICDVVYVAGPVEVTVDVTVAVAWESGDKDSIVAGTTLTQGELVEREVMRAIYKTPVGGRDVDGVGELRASEIASAIQYYLGAGTYSQGLTYQIVGDVTVTLSGGTPNITLATNEAAVPGTITVSNM